MKRGIIIFALTLLTACVDGTPTEVPYCSTHADTIVPADTAQTVTACLDDGWTYIRLVVEAP